MNQIHSEFIKFNRNVLILNNGNYISTFEPIDLEGKDWITIKEFRLAKDGKSFLNHKYTFTEISALTDIAIRVDSISCIIRMDY